MKRHRSVQDTVLDVAFWAMIGLAVIGALTAVVVDLMRFRQAWH